MSCSGKNVPARAQYECECQNKCTRKLAENVKKDILDKFNGLESKNVQDAYLFGLISVRSVER